MNPRSVSFRPSMSLLLLLVSACGAKLGSKDSDGKSGDPLSEISSLAGVCTVQTEKCTNPAFLGIADQLTEGYVDVAAGASAEACRDRADFYLNRCQTQAAVTTTFQI